MPLITPCSNIMAIIDQYNAAMPFVVIVYLALLVIPATQC